MRVFLTMRAVLAALVAMGGLVAVGSTAASGAGASPCELKGTNGPIYMIESPPLSIENVKFGRYLDADGHRKDYNVDTAARRADTTWGMVYESLDCQAVKLSNSERKLFLTEDDDGNVYGAKRAGVGSYWYIDASPDETGVVIVNANSGRYLDADGIGRNYNVDTARWPGAGRVWRLVEPL
jgi:hypothetical protein